jgi:DNA primase
MEHSIEIKRVKVLERVSEIYHKNLLENPEALSYLDKRGIGTPEIIKGFRLGFSRGNITEMISQSGEDGSTGSPTAILEELGIIRRIKNRFGSDGHFEYFKGFIVFPVTDSSGNIVEMYARAVSDTAKAKHRALKGEHAGVWNAKAFKVHNEIILAKSIIDGLSLYRLGFQNVSASFGNDGFTENHLKLMEENSTRKLFSLSKTTFPTA